MANKQRLDIFLVEQGFFPSREKAKTSIMAGLVFVNGQKVDKAGTDIPLDAQVTIQGNVLPYVSRGGLKLEKALKVFKIDLHDKTMMDIGASTGGFTDCALQNGVKKVYAVDVGYGQLDWKLRNDERVINLERTNIRYLERKTIQELPDFISIDVAFISLEKVLPKAYEFLQDSGEMVALIKPQFEAGREKVGKKGVVRDPQVHIEVMQNVIAVAESLGFTTLALDYSPIKGPEGNIEYLLYSTKGQYFEVEGYPADEIKSPNYIKKLVEAAHTSI